MIQINYVRYRTFTLSLRILSGAGTRFIRLNGCVRSQAKPKQGRYERFINNAMMATLLGAVISDGLEDGKIISGVGGQYNFVAQSFALDDARSIIMVRATRNACSELLRRA
jgi:hypothetical protein